MSERDQTGLSRRGLLAGAGSVGVAGLGAFLLANGEHQRTGLLARDPVAPTGEFQAGVDRPTIPQQHCLVAVLDLDVTELSVTLSRLGQQITQLTAQPRGVEELTPEGPADLSITIGLGPESLAASKRPEVASQTRLPLFLGDSALEEDFRGGAMLISVNATDPSVLEPVLSSLVEQVAGARLRWNQFGYRGAPVDGVPRNSLGYFDGIIGPNTKAERLRDIWIDEGPLSGGTICVVRRFQLAIERFRGLDSPEQDAVIGRERITGSPLSGGSRDDEVNLDAKSADGSLLIPATAHVRAAHPSFTGSQLMLRRSYSYRNSETDSGHLFISFQNELETFVRTQLRIDETDALMDFAIPTATAAFAILPGMRSGRDLGTRLFQ